MLMSGFRPLELIVEHTHHNELIFMSPSGFKIENINCSVRFQDCIKRSPCPEIPPYQRIVSPNRIYRNSFLNIGCQPSPEEPVPTSEREIEATPGAGIEPQDS